MLKGIKVYTNHDWIEGIPLEVNEKVAIIQENQLKQNCLYKDCITITAYFVRPESLQFIRKCRVCGYDNDNCSRCGCTNDNYSGCIEKTGGPCRWVHVDLCSACAEKKQC
jgi:hypothetical protein